MFSIIRNFCRATLRNSSQWRLIRAFLGRWFLGTIFLITKSFFYNGWFSSDTYWTGAALEKNLKFQFWIMATINSFVHCTLILSGCMSLMTLYSFGIRGYAPMEISSERSKVSVNKFRDFCLCLYPFEPLYPLVIGHLQNKGVQSIESTLSMRLQTRTTPKQVILLVTLCNEMVREAGNTTHNCISK